MSEQVLAEAPVEGDFRIVSDERFLGPTNRWRRFGEVTPAGGSTKADGTVDYGLFGPGSMVWKVLLHPASIAFESIAQSLLQLTYKPIVAGIRDHDPLSRKARSGKLTYFDAFERFQRNAGMHAPMWLGDTTTAQKMADHLHRVHTRVAGDVIDIGAPELGGYAASEARDAMWAGLTELDAILYIYEAVVEPSERLTQAQRDQFYAETGAYLRLVGAEEDEIPTNEAEVEALYEKYDHLFGHSHTIDIIPETGQDYRKLSADVMQQNFHPSQMKAAQQLKQQFGTLRLPVLGALRDRSRRKAGLSEAESVAAVEALKAALPEMRAVLAPEIERETMRLMWGPDGVALIESARVLHQKALAGELATA